MNDIKITDICPLVEKVLEEHCHHDHHCPHHSWQHEDGRCVLNNCYKQHAFGREYDERDIPMFEQADDLKKLFAEIAAKCNGECSMEYGDDGKVEFTFRPLMVRDASECGCEEKTRKI